MGVSGLNSPADAYAAAYEAAAVADISGHGWLKLAGRDRSDLLQRLSTNDARNLLPGSGLPTALTTATGRVIALLAAYGGEEALYLRTQPRQAPGVAGYLQGLIFWQDQVTVEDLSPDTAQFAVYGPLAGPLLAYFAGPQLEALAPYAWRAASFAGTPASIHRGGSLEPWAWTIVAPKAEARRIWEVLTAKAPVLSAEDTAAIRVEKGLPMWGSELNDHVTPLEAGLGPAVSYTKGCYTGQEVIARQSNYDKVTRVLAGLMLPADAPEGLEGAKIVVAGGRGGFVASVARSPRLGAPIALAIVPRELAAPGTRLSIEAQGGAIEAQVASLPFVHG